MKILGIIPSRYGSTRLPAKALAKIGGKTIVHRVYLQATKASLLTDVVVATDHQAIYDEVTAFGGQAVMTSAQHRSGTDRCMEALQKVGGNYDFVINIQGDEPFIDPAQINQLASILNQQVQLGTLVKKFTDHNQLLSANTAKVILNSKQQAIYFSRAPIPYLRNHPQDQWLQHHTYYKHIGIYAYRTDVLAAVTKLPPSALEEAEALEQLRWIENGYTIHVGLTDIETIGIDTPEDLEAARQAKGH